jgi:hypothetical protein
MKATNNITIQVLIGASHLSMLEKIMGMKSAIKFFLLGFMINGIFTPGVRDIPARMVSGSIVEQLGNTTQLRYLEMAQTDKTKDAEKNEPVLTPEQKKRTSEPAKPKNTTRLKEGPPKDFVPSEKIPADQAVDFPTDI